MSRIKLLLSLFLFLTLSPTLADNRISAQDAMKGKSLQAALQAEGHTRFLKLLTETKLTTMLDQHNVTFLVPDEEWFESLTADEYQTLVSNPEAVKIALQVHTLKGLHPEKELTQSPTLTTLNGEKVGTEMDEEYGLIVNGMVILRADIMGDDFIVHVVDDFFIIIETEEDMPEEMES